MPRRCPSDASLRCQRGHCSTDPEELREVTKMKPAESVLLAFPETLSEEEQPIVIRKLDRVETTLPCGVAE